MNKQDLQGMMSRVQVLDSYGSSAEFKAEVQANHDVRMWLSKLGHLTKPSYVTAFCYLLCCLDMKDPTRLLDLKTYEDRRQRFFPAEQLVEYWVALAKEKKLPAHKIKKVLDAVRSFFKHNRARLTGVTCTYKPRPKPAVGLDDLVRFREAMTFHGKFFLDFLLSVPLRDGQFQVCPNCGRDFHPRWSHIEGYPRVEMGSAFIILPEKGHESSKYSADLRQVCFLTETCASQLKKLRGYRERLLGRKVKPNEPIFTHTQRSQWGEPHVSPVGQDMVIQHFSNARERTGLNIYPHLLRSWVNSVLAAQGIDKQVRDIYLGHNCAYEQGYVLQMIPLWRQNFLEKHALEALDIVNPTQHQIVTLEQELNQLKQKMESPDQKIMEEAAALLRDPEIREGLRELREMRELKKKP